MCVCPTTEGDLGDGVPRTAELFSAGVKLSMGSDSHATIDPFAELRSLEYAARAATGTRCVLRDEAGASHRLCYIRLALLNGYAALSLPSESEQGLADGITLREDARALSPHSSNNELLAAGGDGGASRPRLKRACQW